MAARFNLGLGPGQISIDFFDFLIETSSPRAPGSTSAVKSCLAFDLVMELTLQARAQGRGFGGKTPSIVDIPYTRRQN